MWKDGDGRRDDDSAIGDSEHFSAEEESTNLRRKSTASDDVIGIYQIDPFAHLSAKVGSKVPECLRIGAEESVVNCKKHKSNKDDNNNAKNKRVITVLPASAMQKNITSLKRKTPTKENKTAIYTLETQLQFLILEMKKLRELDRDVLRKFVRINDSVDEMKWKIEENEADMKRILENDVTLSDSRTFEDLEEKPDELDMTYIPVTVAATAYASLTSVKSKSSSVIHNYARVTGILNSDDVTSPPQISASQSPENVKVAPQNNYPIPAKRNSSKKRLAETRSFTNPTYSNVNVGKSDEVQILDEVVRGQTENGNYYGNNLKRAVSAFSSVPPKRVPHEPLRSHNHQQYHQQDKLQQQYQQQKQKLQQQEQRLQQQHALQKQRQHEIIQQQEYDKQRLQDKYQQQQYNNSNYVGRKYNARLQQNGNFPVKNSAFRQFSNQEPSNNSFKEQQDYQNLIGLSRVRAQHQPDPRRVPPPRLSGRSLTSSSSLASSTSSSSSSIVSPNRVSRSNSVSKWPKLGFHKLTKSNSVQEKVKSFNKSERRSLRNNHYPQAFNDVIPHGDHVVAVSYKRTANDSVYNWIRNQDDVTYL